MDVTAQTNDEVGTVFAFRNEKSERSCECERLNLVERLGFGAARAVLRRYDHDTAPFLRDHPHNRRRWLLSLPAEAAGINWRCEDKSSADFES